MPTTNPKALALTAGLALTTAALAQQPAGADADLPINKVTLYRSGVAAYERSGFVEGDATLRMLFDENALDDVLKSLVILDAGGGRMTGVNYTVSEPVSRRLAALGLSTGDLSIDGLLRALKGVKVRLTYNTTTADAVILGLSERNVPTPDAGSSLQKFLTIMQGPTVRSIPVNAIAHFEIIDAELAGEFAGVLAELNRQRGELQKAVEVQLQGDDRRRLGAMYIAPAPVWKTSYRLVLDENDDQASLVGMAIVENTSDQDWQDITLSLVSARPVGFTMPLSQPIYTNRPTIPVPVELAMNSTIFEAGVQLVQPSKREIRARGGGLADRQEIAAMGRRNNAITEKSETDAAFGYASIANTALANASSGEAGDVFVYTVDTPVSVGRQSSAMIPIINTPIDAQRVSIFTQSDTKHPMRGVRMTNASDLELLAGPITVYDSTTSAGTYQGDARIDRVAQGDEKLLAYAQDLDLTITRKDTRPRRRIDVKIINGVYQLRRWQWNTTTYTIDNTDQDRPRTLVLEHPKYNDWQLEADSTPRETVGSSYRFDIPIKAGDTKEWKVSQKRIETESFALSSLDAGRLFYYANEDGSLPKDVREVFKKYAEKRAEISGAKAELNRLERERDTITTDQARIRKNMDALDRQSDLYRRYVKTLTEGEDRLEVLKGHIADWQKNVADLEAALNKWLTNVDAD